MSGTAAHPLCDAPVIDGKRRFHLLSRQFPPGPAGRELSGAVRDRDAFDGAWHLPDDSPEATVRQTALAIETIIICLQ